MKLVIKFPTRSRPHKFKPLLDKYIDFLSGKHDVRFVITMDEDDETMNNDDIKSSLKTISHLVLILFTIMDTRRQRSKLVTQI